jgi:hypothetical protein
VVNFSPGALPPGKKPQYPLIGGLGWVPVPVGTSRGKHEKPLPLPEFETRTVAFSSSLTKLLQVMLCYTCTRDVGLTRGCMFVFSCVS